jgi:hypothetical protein
VISGQLVLSSGTVAQRKLDPAHAQKLAVYILKGLVAAAIERREILKKPPSQGLNETMQMLGRQPYMSVQPLVVNIRSTNPRGNDIRADRLLAQSTGETASFKVYLSQRHVLWVVDGQHRRKAMELVFEFLEQLRATKTYPSKKNNLLGSNDGKALSPEELDVWEECFEVARTYCTLLIEVHLGLTPIQERQLFHDLNRLGKKVDTNLALQFDSSNPINLFIKDELIGSLGLHVVESDVKNWKDDDGGIARKDLVSVNALLFLNKTNIGGATPPMVDGKTAIAKRFWTAVQAIPGFGEEHAREKTVSAQPVVLKAIAKLVYDFSFNARRPDDGDNLTERLLSGISDIDFGHDNPMWKFYELSPGERLDAGLAGLEEYLPATDGANRDIGSSQGGVMRFGAKHNDIYPLIGDMIRWKLGLLSRRGNTETMAKAA